jgi:hypothetical protein
VLFDVRVIAFDPQAAVDPVEALIRLFKIERSFAREVVHRLPRVIKRGVSLEMAQRLAQVLERIGAQVEILISERASDQAESQAQPGSVLGPARAASRGLPPPSPESLVQHASNTNTHVAAALVRRAPAYAANSPDTMASLPDPSLRDDGSVPLRQLAGVRASLPQSQEARRVAAAPRQADAPAPNGRTPARQALPNNDAGLGRMSLPMGTWSDATDQEESRVTRASLSDVGAVSIQEPERPSMVGLTLGKPSVKEILARRSLSQTGAGVERITRGEANPAVAPGSRAEPLSLPTFSARGPSLGDDIDELPETASLRRKLTFLTVLIFVVAGIFSLTLLPLAIWMGRFTAKRRRERQLRERQASSVMVGHAQLPELYHCVKHLAMRLELSPSPRLYVVERLPSKVQSFTQRGALVIALDAGLLSACARRDAGYVLQFILAHEMAAHVLGQHRGGRQLLAAMWANLRKHEFFSADALAAKLMAERSEPVRALTALLCGPELAHLIDLNELDRQAGNQEQDAAKAQASADDDPLYLLPRILFLRRTAGK